MKKNIIFLAILLSVMVSIGCAKKKEMVIGKGTINGMVGNVTIKERGKTHQAKVGDFVAVGMTIETGTKSLVEIYFGENIIRVLENTTLFINKFELNIATDSEQTELNLQIGEVFSKINKKLTKGDSYQIRTPTTIAGVRGTEFGVLERDGITKVTCISGKVVVTSLSLQKEKKEPDFVEISANEEVQVLQDQPLEVRPLSEKDKKRMEDIFSNIGSPNPELEKENVEEEKKEDVDSQTKKPQRPKRVREKGKAQKEEL